MLTVAGLLHARIIHFLRRLTERRSSERQSSSLSISLLLSLFLQSAAHRPEESCGSV